MRGHIVSLYWEIIILLVQTNRRLRKLSFSDGREEVYSFRKKANTTWYLQVTLLVETHVKRAVLGYKLNEVWRPGFTNLDRILQAVKILL